MNSNRRFFLKRFCEYFHLHKELLEKESLRYAYELVLDQLVRYYLEEGLHACSTYEEMEEFLKFYYNLEAKKYAEELEAMSNRILFHAALIEVERSRQNKEKK